MERILFENREDFLRMVGQNRLAKLKKMEHDNFRIPKIVEVR
jgi:hypothetical protein